MAESERMNVQLLVKNGRVYLDAGDVIAWLQSMGFHEAAKELERVRRLAHE